MGPSPHWRRRPRVASSTMNRSRSSGCLVQLLILALLYVLSQGPVLAMYATQRMEGPVPSAVNTFYAPMSWLRSETPLGGPLKAYADWWVKVLKPA